MRKIVIIAAACFATSAAAQTLDIINWCNRYNRNPMAAARCIRADTGRAPAGAPVQQAAPPVMQQPAPQVAPPSDGKLPPEFQGRWGSLSCLDPRVCESLIRSGNIPEVFGGVQDISATSQTLFTRNPEGKILVDHWEFTNIHRDGEAYVMDEDLPGSPRAHDQARMFLVPVNGRVFLNVQHDNGVSDRSKGSLLCRMAASDPWRCLGN
jgi:hypothetical protein